MDEGDKTRNAFELKGEIDAVFQADGRMHNADSDDGLAADKFKGVTLNIEDEDDSIFHSPLHTSPNERKNHSQ